MLLRKFLYLRITVAITTIMQIGYLLFILWMLIRGMENLSTEQYIFNIAWLLILISHGIITMILLGKNYPATEIQKNWRIIYKVCTVIAWISVCFISLAVLVFLIATDFRSDYPGRRDILNLFVFLFFLLMGLNIIQLIGGRRLVSTIQRNSSHEFEEMFK
jgi:hypothetical protein